jgi:hypothetical protein
VIMSLKSLRMCIFHTFPPFFGARIAGMGIGGRDIASVISSPDLGVWSRVNLAFFDGMCFLGLVGVCAGPGELMISAARTAPLLVRLSVHATRWNFGEVENSLGLFLDIAECRGWQVIELLYEIPGETKQGSAEIRTVNWVPYHSSYIFSLHEHHLICFMNCISCTGSKYQNNQATTQE